MTASTWVSAPITITKPTRKVFSLVAGFVGAVAALLIHVMALLSVDMWLPAAVRGSIAVIVGTFMTGRKVGARSGKRWAVSISTIVFYLLLIPVTLRIVAMAI
jgi:hypothetical protein